MIEQKRYKVAIKNAKDCRSKIKFLDLNITYSNGYSHPLELMEGEELPLDLLNPDDIRKSFRVGSLKGYLENGWIIEIPEEIKKEEKIEIKNEQPILNKEVPSLPSQGIQPILKEAVEINKSIEISQVEPLTDLAKVLSYDDFCKLSQLLKLRFIKDCYNVDLLRQIASSTPSVQIKNNVQLRLSQLKF